MRVIHGAILCVAFAAAIPTITFPINSQVPPVARVSIPFKFTFSAFTFSGIEPLNYTMSNAPSWLSLDGSTRTLSGIAPESVANTAPTIQIIASDNTGTVSMNTTLVISGNPAPVVVVPLDDQLKSLGTYSWPSSILYYPSTPFNFTFDPKTFGESPLSHYAIMADNSPLPAWISFDRTSLSFFGKTPESSSLVQPPQIWVLQLIASDVSGFAGTAARFNIVVGNHELAFKDGSLVVNATIGTLLNYTGLMDSLYLDGKMPSPSDIVSADAETPHWMEFYNSTFVLSGTPPVGTTSFSVSVTVVDIHGDIASAAVLFRIATTLFLETIGSLNATVGMPFSFEVGSLFSNVSDVVVSVQIDPSTPWLSFNKETLSLNGNVPPDTQPSNISITVAATSKSSLTSGSQKLTLIIVSIFNHTPSATITLSSVAAATSTYMTTTAGNTAPAGTLISKRLSRGEIVAIVAPIVILSVALLFLCFYCYRRRPPPGRRAGCPDKSGISKPIPPPCQTEERLEVQDWVTNSDAYTNATISSKRNTAALKRHSRVISTPRGVSTNLKDSRSSGTRGRSYSENRLLDFGGSWRSTQDSAYTPLPKSVMRYSSTRSACNFSRTASAPLLPTDRSTADLSGSTVGKRISKGSKSSIQPTPDFAYDSANMRKQRLSQGRALDYLDISGRIGHGSHKTAAGRLIICENRSSLAFSHGTGSQYSKPESSILPSDGNSWLTIGSADLKEQHRRSVMSVLTESTEVLNSPKMMAIRQVPKSPDQPVTTRLSASYKPLQAGSKRALGASPFFAGSSRVESLGTSRKSLTPVRSRYLYSSSPPSRDLEAANNEFEKSIATRPRDVELSSSEPVSNFPSDYQSITYGSPREHSLHLRDYINTLGRRLSLSGNSLNFSGSDSHFRSTEPSPELQRCKETQDRERKLAYQHNRHEHNLQESVSPASFGRGRYCLDESPQFVQPMGAETAVQPSSPSPFADYLTPERYMPSLSTNAVRNQSVVASLHDFNDEADISLDDVHGAFL